MERVHHDLNAWYEAIFARETSPVYALLLTLLPNLTTLYLMDTWEYRREYLDSIMDAIARDAIESSKSLVKPSYAQWNLQTLYLNNEDEETGIHL